MKRSFIFTVLFLAGISFTAFSSDKPAYRIFTAKGKSADYGDIVKAARSSAIIYFGELHDNPICHWMEFQLVKDLLKGQNRTLVLGAEMFETDNQLLLNEYVTRQIIRKKDFVAEAKLWPNYKTDYSPIVDFARENKIKFIATSVPRRFAAIVNQRGFEGLDNIMANERGLMAPLPIPYDSSLACYKNIGMAVEGAPHMGVNLAKAQALKDATMAWFILKNTMADSSIFLNFNGAYHSENYEGVVWMTNQYLRRGTFSPRLLTVSCVEQKDLDDLDKANVGIADFIIVIPSDMTKTYAVDSPFIPAIKPSADTIKKQEVKSIPKPAEKPQSASDDDDDD